MKAVLEKLQPKEYSSFIVRQFETLSFEAPFHFHPEYELTLILKGEGQRYVGQQVNNFQEGDLVFLGTNLPHCWLSQPKPEQMAEAIVVQFNSNFLGKDFMYLPETLQLRAFLEKSKAGFEILGDTKKNISKKITELVHQKSLQSVSGLLDILAILSQTKEIAAIDSSFYKQSYSQLQTARFQQVFSYLIDNFREDISLEKIAEIAHLTPTSFCRYFKSITQKTFIQIVLEYRIAYACQLLRTTQMPVQAIVFESGFSDVPYFNKVFRKYKKQSPLMYRKQKISE